MINFVLAYTSRRDAMSFEMTPPGPFNLATANEYFGGWVSFGPGRSGLAMAFPVEGWQTSAAVTLHQLAGGTISGEVHGAGEYAEKARQQALAACSLDSPASDWPAVGQRDPVIGNLQQRYNFLRPVLFHSPYESAASFIIGHRISMRQGRAIRQAMAQDIGEKLSFGDMTLYAFPQPQILRDLTAFKGLNDEKIQRLHNIAEAALDGLLDRTYLRSLPTDQALAKLRSLRGVGAFFSQGILLRGAGLLDEIPDDDVTKEAVQLAYKLPQRPNQKAVLHIAEAWRPYRMWSSVLLHVWLRREMGGPHRQP
jgi:DNA-3-methyladenine glycosylase II